MFNRPDNLTRFGGAYRLTQIPVELQVIRRGRDPSHFEIVPARPMTLRDYEEASAKGASVRLADGACYALAFYDPVRLSQTLEDDAGSGRPFFAEPNLIVLPEVTEAAMRRAVEQLAQQGFFQKLKPLS